VWVEVSEHDAARLGIADGDAVEVSTPRGTITCASRITASRDGVLFVPFHYGYFDTDRRGHHRAGNELTITDWDPVSKQPIFKTAAAQLRRRPRTDRRATVAPTTAASAPVNAPQHPTVGGPTAMATEVSATQATT
jgi:predicted molibdopterin-dependent oxidoreductase YjgC